MEVAPARPKTTIVCCVQAENIVMVSATAALIALLLALLGRSLTLRVLKLPELSTTTVLLVRQANSKRLQVRVIVLHV